MRILDVGCGTSKRDGAVGIDCNPRSAADVIHDLNVFPYPFADNEFDLIWCMDVLEHLHNIVGTMEELWRIGKPGAKVVIKGPFFADVGRHVDPTHVRGFSRRSFDYFIEGTPLYNKYRYSKAAFRLLSWDYDPDPELKLNRSWLYYAIYRLAKKRPLFYEARLANIYTMQFIQYELQVVKS